MRRKVWRIPNPIPRRRYGWIFSLPSRVFRSAFRLLSRMGPSVEAPFMQMRKKISGIPPEFMVGNGQVSKLRGGQTVNAKKERELFASGLDRLLKKQRKIVDDYRALAEMLDGDPVGRLLDWVVIEEEAHRTLLINIIQSLKQTAKKAGGEGADGVAIERETMLYWVKRISMNEQTVVAVCRTLKSQAYWENGNVIDAFLDALVMDSEKHQRFLSAVEKSIENLLMSRPQ